MASLSNSGGATGRDSLGKGGTARPNGKQRGDDREASLPSGGGSGGGSGAVRPNGTQPAGLGGEGEAQSYKAPYATNKQKIAPTKTGGVR